jgi:hypothetical protein
MTITIRTGYAISYECLQPTPMILSVHPSRRRDLITPDRMRLEPLVVAKEYCDGFGNICHVIQGWPLVQAICDFVHDHITFGYQHANPTKTAYEAF